MCEIETAAPETPVLPPELFLLKLGEVVLKGLNRSHFEDKLIANVARRLRPLGTFRIYTRQSTIYVEPQSGVTDMDAVYHACSQIFGIVSVVRAVPCEKSVPAIVETAKLYLAPEFARAKDFKVESKRADKRFPLNSIQLSQQVGSLLHRAFPKTAVNVHDPELTVYVEIRERAAYVHGPTLPGAGGLPVGMGGKAVSLLSGGIDSPVASWMMARRGVWLEMVHFESPPYTSPQAQEKVLRLAQELAPWCGQLLVHIVPFTEIQEEIRRNCPEEYFTLIMRRFMMRIAEAIARKANAGALVTGESLGQVASQTVQSLAATNEVCTMPVFRPVIGFDKQEIVERSWEIGTYETSIQPFEDCCTIFVAKHPVTKPNLNVIHRSETKLEEKIDELMKTALETVEIIEID